VNGPLERGRGGDILVVCRTKGRRRVGRDGGDIEARTWIPTGSLDRRRSRPASGPKGREVPARRPVATIGDGKGVSCSRRQSRERDSEQRSHLHFYPPQFRSIAARPPCFAGTEPRPRTSARRALKAVRGRLHRVALRPASRDWASRDCGQLKISGTLTRTRRGQPDGQSPDLMLLSLMTLAQRTISLRTKASSWSLGAPLTSIPCATSFSRTAGVFTALASSS
jgi:hypothetical protein